MTRGLAEAELRKLLSVRTTWLVAALVAAFGALSVVFAMSFGGTGMDAGSAAYQAMLLRPEAGFFALLLGTVLMTGEFRHGTIVPAVLATPSRCPLLVPKVLVAAAAGVLLTVTMLVAQTVVALPWLAALGEPLAVSAADVAGDTARSAAYAALVGALGLGVGAVLRNQLVAVVAVVMLEMLGPLVLLAPDIGWYAPVGLHAVLVGDGIGPLGDGAGAPFGPAAAAGIMAAYAAVATAAGGLLLARRDVG